jgi:hypothetical protein
MVVRAQVVLLIIFFLFSSMSHGTIAPQTGPDRKKKVPPKFKSVKTEAAKPKAKPKKTKPKKPVPPPLPPKPAEKTIETRILKAGDAVQRVVEKTAERTDLLIAGKRYTKKKNKSKITYRQFVTFQDGRGVKFPGDFGFSLRLPNLEKRWQLRFSSYDEEADRRNLQQQRVRTTAPPKDYGAGLFFFEKLGNIKTSFQPRLLLTNPLAMSYTLRFENEANVEWIKLNSRVELFADPKKGTGQYSSLEFRFRLGERTDLGFQNSEEYTERNNFFSTQHGLTLDYSLTPTRAIGTGLNALCNNKAQYHLDQYTYSWVIAEQIYPERLLMSLTPFIGFYKAKGFQGKTGITLQAYLTF